MKKLSRQRRWTLSQENVIARRLGGPEILYISTFLRSHLSFLFGNLTEHTEHIPPGTPGFVPSTDMTQLYYAVHEHTT